MANLKNPGMGACAAKEPDLVLYYYGDLEFDARTGIETHLRDCAGCRSYLEELRSFLPSIAAADQPPEPFWDGYRREMRQKLDDAAETKSWWQRVGSLFQPWPIPAIATAAVVGLAVAVTLRSGIQQEPEPPKETQALIEVLPVAENLEFFSNMDVLDSMDLLEQMGAQANGTS